MKLWLLRHARPLVDSGICYGALDVAADALATEQAAREAARVLPQGLSVWFSPLQRCEQLAHILQGLRPDLHMQSDSRLREMDFGCWEGVAWASIPKQALDDWVVDFGSHRFGGAESTNAVLARVVQAGVAFSKRVGPGGQGLWITHAGVVRSVQLWCQGVRQVQHAAQWPIQGLPYGGLLALELPPADEGVASGGGVRPG